jgi:hypothetical protein
VLLSLAFRARQCQHSETAALRSSIAIGSTQSFAGAQAATTKVSRRPGLTVERQPIGGGHATHSWPPGFFQALKRPKSTQR